jgi:hypothetical protein
MIRVAAVLLVLLSSLLAGCGSECGRLADEVCRSRGEDSIACRTAANVPAGSALARDAACRRALLLLRDLPEDDQAR